MDLPDLINEHIRRVAEARERACEAAVQSGRYGVLELRWPNGDVTFKLSEDVPYGCLHEQSAWAFGGQEQ